MDKLKSVSRIKTSVFENIIDFLSKKDANIYKNIAGSLSINVVIGQFVVFLYNSMPLLTLRKKNPSNFLRQELVKT